MEKGEALELMAACMTRNVKGLTLEFSGCRRQSGDRRERTLNDLLCAGGYWCVVCGRHLPADKDGVIVHDDVPHPEDMTFDEEERPQ